MPLPLHCLQWTLTTQFRAWNDLTSKVVNRRLTHASMLHGASFLCSTAPSAPMPTPSSWWQLSQQVPCDHSSKFCLTFLQVNFSALKRCRIRKDEALYMTATSPLKHIHNTGNRGSGFPYAPTPACLKTLSQGGGLSVQSRFYCQLWERVLPCGDLSPGNCAETTQPLHMGQMSARY